MSLEFESLNDIAEAMTVKGKGILAMEVMVKPVRKDLILLM